MPTDRDGQSPGGLRIYVASSWRNARQPSVVAVLREAGHEVYDFRNPAPGNTGFAWRQCDPRPPSEWTVADYRRVLATPHAQEGFAFDMAALRACDVCVLVLPCGRSAHLELGWAAGAGKRALVLCEHLDEPELMYLMCGGPEIVCESIGEVVARLESARAERGHCGEGYCIAPLTHLASGCQCQCACDRCCRARAVVYPLTSPDAAPERP